MGTGWRGVRNAWGLGIAICLPSRSRNSCERDAIGQRGSYIIQGTIGHKRQRTLKEVMGVLRGGSVGWLVVENVNVGLQGVVLLHKGLGLGLTILARAMWA